MSDLIEKLKSMKNSSKTQVNNTIYDYSVKRVKQYLKEEGLDWDDLAEEDINELIADEIEKNKKFAKGVLAGSSFFLLLELLG